MTPANVRKVQIGVGVMFALTGIGHIALQISNPPMSYFRLAQGVLFLIAGVWIAQKHLRTRRTD
jgi:putative Ca2+/H+ antiporter (TMEM165/GDT1 family)